MEGGTNFSLNLKQNLNDQRCTENKGAAPRDGEIYVTPGMQLGWGQLSSHFGRL